MRTFRIVKYGNRYRVKMRFLWIWYYKLICTGYETWEPQEWLSPEGAEDSIRSYFNEKAKPKPKQELVKEIRV